MFPGPFNSDLIECPLDWWEGKVAYYKYKGKLNLNLPIFSHFSSILAHFWPFLVIFCQFSPFFKHFPFQQLSQICHPFCLLFQTMGI